MSEPASESAAEPASRAPVHVRDRRAAACNAVGAVASLALATLLATWGRDDRDAERDAPPVPHDTAFAVAPERRDGRRVLVDASGEAIALERFERIASASSLADPVLLAVCESDRILSFSSRSQRLSPDRHRYASKPGIDTTHKLEPLLMLKPDLVLLNALGNARHVTRLRAAGLTVFDLGAMRGVETLTRSILQIGWLVGAPERAERYARRFRQQMEAVAAAVPLAERKGAIYVGTHGQTLYGGTRGTSFGDVLRYAGLIDVAAEKFSGWPSYDPEQLLLLDPEVVVTQTGMARTLCRHTELGRLRACHPGDAGGQIIEVGDAVLGDPGVGMLDAAERIVRRAYPERYGDAIEGRRR